MQIEIISPEAVLYSGKVQSILVPGTDGEFEILAHHAPIISTLESGTIKIVGAVPKANTDIFSSSTNDIYTLSIQSGAVEVSDDKIILIAEL